MAMLKGVTFTEYTLNNGTIWGNAPKKLANNCYQFIKGESGLIFPLGAYTTSICAMRVKFAAVCAAKDLYMYMLRKKSTTTSWHMVYELSSFKAGVEYTFLMDFTNHEIKTMQDGVYRSTPDVRAYYSTGTIASCPTNKCSFVFRAWPSFNANGNAIVDIESFAYALNLPNDTKLLYEQSVYKKDRAVYGMKKA